MTQTPWCTIRAQPQVLCGRYLHDMVMGNSEKHLGEVDRQWPRQTDYTMGATKCCPKWIYDASTECRITGVTHLHLRRNTWSCWCWKGLWTNKHFKHFSKHLSDACEWPFFVPSRYPTNTVNPTTVSKQEAPRVAPGERFATTFITRLFHLSGFCDPDSCLYLVSTSRLWWIWACPSAEKPSGWVGPEEWPFFPLPA